jgi:D-threo-aldose 1-dehydrogenase
MSFPLRPLGRTGLSVTELGFGTAPLGNLFRPLPDETSRATLQAAEKAGFGYYDTAPFYGFGLSERRLGDALRHRKNVVLSTKAGRLLAPVPGPVDKTRVRHGYATPMPFEPVFDYSYSAIMRVYEGSLQRLGLSRIDILYIHDIGTLTHGEQNAARMAELTRGGGLRALEELREGGAIAGFGMGVNEVAACLEVMDHARLDVILLAGRYSLLEQTPLDVLFPACEKAGTAIVIGGPYNSGSAAYLQLRAGAGRCDRQGPPHRSGVRASPSAAGRGGAAISPGAFPGCQCDPGAGFAGSRGTDTVAVPSQDSTGVVAGFAQRKSAAVRCSDTWIEFWHDHRCPSAFLGSGARRLRMA